jgi:hypothetical protein
VAAGISEHPRATVAAAHREERYPEGDTFGMIARIGDGRGRHEDARERAQRLELVSESDWVQIVLDRFAPGIAFVGCARVDVRKDSANDLQIVGDRRLCRSAHTEKVSHYDRHASTIS